MRPPRSLVGPADAPVRITEFSDILCGHCASLHEMLTALRAKLPPGCFSIDPRQFPLDGACNSNIPMKMSDPIRCTAAKAIICAEQEQRAFDFAGELFRSRQPLTEERIYALAKPFLSREELAACISDPVTEAALRDDIAWAMSCDIKGTPLVLVNGRMVPAFPPFLHAILLAGGDAKHPLFAYLPRAKLRKPRRR